MRPPAGYGIPWSRARAAAAARSLCQGQALVCLSAREGDCKVKSSPRCRRAGPTPPRREQPNQEQLCRCVGIWSRCRSAITVYVSLAVSRQFSREQTYSKVRIRALGRHMLETRVAVDHSSLLADLEKIMHGK